MEETIARGIQILIALGGAYLLTIWFALIVWTFQDIQLRSRSVVAQIFSTLVVVLFFVPGVLIYLILRPRDTLDDAFQRSLEEEYLLQDLDELLICPTCQHQVEADFIYCPHCRGSLRAACVSCNRLIDLRWDICPYCGEEQYPEELPLQVPEEWRSIEREGVGSFLEQARERLSVHRPRAITPETTKDQRFAPPEPLTDPVDQHTAEWDLRDPQDGGLAEHPGDRAGSNGSVGAPASDGWNGSDDEDRDALRERTDELPSRPTRR